MESKSRYVRFRGFGRFVWPALFVAVVGLGLCGHLALHPGSTLPEALYRTARLFTLNLDGRNGVQPPWQLWFAAALAPLLLVRGVAELFRDRLRGVTTRFLVTPEVVVFGAGHRAAALISAPGQRRGTVVVVDPEPRGLAAMRELDAWTVTGDGLSARSLRRAASGKAANVVIATGDDQLNCAVTTALQEFLTQSRRPGRPQIYVEVEEPGLARTVERGGTETGVTTTPFSASALAAADVLDELDGPGGELLGTGRAVPSVVLFGQGPLVDAVVLELHRRRRDQLLGHTEPVPPVPRVAIFGPDAVGRLDALRALLGSELERLDVEALDVALDQAVELTQKTARRLLDYQPLRQVLVLTADDLQGGAIATTLARHLGQGLTITVVTEGPATTFGQRIIDQTTNDETLVPARAFRVPELAYPLRRLQQQRTEDRLARAMYESATTDRTLRWTALEESQRKKYRDNAGKLLDGESKRLIRTDAFMAVNPPEIPILKALGFDRYAELATAGIAVELRAPSTLARAGEMLLSSQNAAGFGVWCEVARLCTDPEKLAGWDRSLNAVARADPADLDDVHRLVLLKLHLLGDRNARAELAAPSGDTRFGDPPIVIVGGDADDAAPELREMLEWSLGKPNVPATVIEPVGDSGVRRMLREVAAACGAGLRPPADTSDPPVRRHLHLWSQLIGSGTDPATVRVLALPGGDSVWPQLLIARALGARIGWLPLPSAGATCPDPARSLLGGAAGMVELPLDRMTVRAFLRPSRWDRIDVPRDRIAARLHGEYVRRQRDRKEVRDPALRPWAQLAPALQDSNRAAVDDIPAKLAAVGLRLCPLAEGAWPAGWPDQATLELLAEMEHGRWNAERLLGGWTDAVRDPGRFLTPHLKPWGRLDAETKNWDREIVRDIPTVLLEEKLGATHLLHPARQLSR